MVSRKLNTDLTAHDKTKAAFASMNRSIGSMKKGMGALTVGIAAAVAGATLLVNRSIDLADSIDKSARAIGIGAESLQRWRFVATQAGGSTEKFDASMLKLRKGIGEARQEGGTMLTFFKNYDKQLLKSILATTDAEDAVLLIVDAMRNAKDASDAAAIGSAAFGRQFKTMANIAGMTAKEVDALKGSLNGVISDEAIAQGVDLADAMDKLQTEFDAGLTNAILENAGGLKELAKEAGLAIPQLIQAGLEIAKFFGLVDATELDALKRQRDILADRLDGSVFGVQTPWFVPDSKDILQYDRVLNRIAEIEKSSAVSTAGPGANDNDPDEDPPLVSQFGDLFGKKFKLGDAVDAREERDFLTRKQLLIDAEKEHKDGQELLNQIMADGARLTDAMLTPTEALTAAEGDLNLMLAALAITEDTHARAMKNLKVESLLAADGIQGAMARAFEDIDFRMAQIDVFSNDVFSNMANSAKDAVNDIISEMFRMMAIKPLLDAVFSTGGLLGALTGAAYDAVQARAGGGPVNGNQPYLVGEEGPEIFTPGSSGRITPNNKIGQGGGGGGSAAPTIMIEQHIHFDVGLESFDQRIEQVTPVIAERSVQAMQDAQERSYGTAI